MEPAGTMLTLETRVEETLRRVEHRLSESARSEDPRLASMAARMIGAGGKRLRPRLAALSYFACGGDPRDERIVDAAAGFELIHTATLVHDDVIDGGTERRGVPSTFAEHGLGAAIVTGDFLFVKGFELAAKLPSEIVTFTARACQALAEGERLELDREPSLERYLLVVRKKTAEPFRSCAEVGAYLAGASAAEREALARYGLSIGMAFQLVDDLLDLTGDAATLGKPAGVDLAAGLPTAPALIALSFPFPSNGHKARVRALVEDPRRTPAEDAELREQLVGSGAVDAAHRLAAGYVHEAKAAIGGLGSREARQALAVFADAVLDRKK
ncbi:MAG: polyprenyl synthetase family protein [Methanobacteriota archaeon]